VNLELSCLEVPEVARRPVEIVERKGLGHPDSICDALAEELSLSLSRFYLEHFGLILHHNVDKALLWAGAADPRFGGGRVHEPIQLFLAGRAVCEADGIRVPVEELAREGSRRWLRAHLHALDPEHHVEIHSLVRPGASELVELYRRQHAAGVPLANDTSLGVGYAPLSTLERIVGAVERGLNAPELKTDRPEVGEDVKVMGVRRDRRIRLTVACAFVDRFVAHTDDYLAKRARVAEYAAEIAGRQTGEEVEVQVNTADDPDAGSLYLTVTGTSAEAGDDGEAGRGNRANGLITPDRPMTLESLAGKNPVTHVGKLYNLAAGLLAAALVDAIPEVAEAHCRLVSQIGRPVTEPQIVDVRIRCADGSPPHAHAPRVRAIAAAELQRVATLWQDLVEERLGIDRWPFEG
jgi:S-adenosylmethionine synthetase